MPANTSSIKKPKIKKPNGGRFIVSTVIFLAVAAAVSFHCYRDSILGIDVLGYAGVVALGDSGSVVKAHDAVYSARLNPHVLGRDEDSPQALDMRQRAADPYAAALHFPYFAIKPLFILTLQAVHRSGITVVDSVRLTVALFYFAIAAMLWVYTRSWLVLVIMILPETMFLGQTQDPDGMSCFFMLLGLWLVFFKQKDMGLLPLLLAIWIRPENALLCVLVVLALVFQGRVDWQKALVLIVLSVGSELVISHYGYAWNEVYGHFLGAAPGSGAASPFANFSLSLVRAAIAVLHSAVPLFGLLWLVCFPFVREDLRWIMGITLVFSVVRFVLVPGYEPRYYGLFFLTTAIAGLVMIQNGHYGGMASDVIRNLGNITSRRLGRKNLAKGPEDAVPVSTRADRASVTNS